MEIEFLMATFLFDDIVFGPVNSRRLGVSLGINLLPVNKKVCSFDCLYCECGLNAEGHGVKGELPTQSMFADALRTKLQEMVAEDQLPDVITFAGNGEPTMHPDFLQIINTTVALRDQYCSSAQISVLSNSTRLHLPEVVQGLEMVDLNILKLDSAIEETVQLLDRPKSGFNLHSTIERLAAFEGKVIIQTLFCRGETGGQRFDNTTEEEIEAWLNALTFIQPDSVMIYSISRDTPIQSIEKVEKAELDSIAKRVSRLGFKVEAY